MTEKTVTRTRRAAVAKSVQAKPGKFFVLIDGARPTNGAMLYAHTHAALTFLGMFDGKAALKKAVMVLIGKHATEYHTGNKNFTVQGNHLKLSVRGLKTFTARKETGKFSEDVAAAYLQAIAKGKADENFGIRKDYLEPVTDCPIR